MRTTVTLDDDVAAELARIQAERRVTFRRALNDLVREGLTARGQRRVVADSVPTTRSRQLGPRVPDFDNTSDLIALLEGEAHR